MATCDLTRTQEHVYICNYTHASMHTQTQTCMYTSVHTNGAEPRTFLPLPPEVLWYVLTLCKVPAARVKPTGIPEALVVGWWV